MTDGSSDLNRQRSVREQIVSRARTLYLSSGFRKVTMDDLAADLGMSKKTLYQQFPSKDAVLKAVLDSKFADVHSDLTQILAREEQPMPVQLGELLAKLQEHIHEISPGFLRDVERSDPALFQYIADLRQEVLTKYFGALLEKGQREGAVRADVPVVLMMDVFIMTARNVVTPTRLNQLKMSPEIVFQHLVDLLLHGILADDTE